MCSNPPNLQKSVEISHLETFHFESCLFISVIRSKNPGKYQFSSSIKAQYMQKDLPLKWNTHLSMEEASVWIRGCLRETRKWGVMFPGQFGMLITNGVMLKSVAVLPHAGHLVCDCLHRVATAQGHILGNMVSWMPSWLGCPFSGGASISLGLWAEPTLPHSLRENCFLCLWSWVWPRKSLGNQGVGPSSTKDMSTYSSDKLETPWKLFNHKEQGC